MAYAKYRNKKTVLDGITFDSKLEAKRWQELQILQRAGQIMGLTRQVPFPLMVNGVKVCTYNADFVYFENDGSGVQIVEDAKGMRTREFMIKAKLFKAIHGFDIMLSDGLGATARRSRKK